MKAKELKKFKILQNFSNYKAGEIVEFYDAKDDDFTERLIKAGKIELLTCKVLPLFDKKQSKKSGKK